MSRSVVLERVKVFCRLLGKKLAIYRKPTGIPLAVEAAQRSSDGRGKNKTGSAKQTAASEEEIVRGKPTCSCSFACSHSFSIGIYASSTIFSRYQLFNMRALTASFRPTQIKTSTTDFIPGLPATMVSCLSAFSTLNTLVFSPGVTRSIFLSSDAHGDTFIMMNLAVYIKAFNSLRRM